MKLLHLESQFKAETSLSSGGLPAVNLKWLSPKLEGGPEGITNCIGTYRISPLDVLARHSTCLTNFLTSGTFMKSTSNLIGLLPYDFPKGDTFLVSFLSKYGWDYFL